MDSQTVYVAKWPQYGQQLVEAVRTSCMDHDPTRGRRHLPYEKQEIPLIWQPRVPSETHPGIPPPVNWCHSSCRRTVLDDNGPTAQAIGGSQFVVRIVS